MRLLVRFIYMNEYENLSGFYNNLFNKFPLKSAKIGNMSNNMVASDAR